MSALSDAQLREALQRCADEPAHAPGAVQTVGALIACEAATGVIDHVSANIEDHLGVRPEALLGRTMRDALGSSCWHALRNAAALPGFADRREAAGALEGARPLDIYASQSGDRYVIELEPSAISPIPAATVLREVAALQEKILGLTGETELFRSALRLLKAASGYDRVLAYRFDEAFNGEVIAEARKARVESFDGMRFPHWDIPPQARALMHKVPIRFIADIDAQPAPILALDAASEPLDITYAQIRGVSPVHLQYLRNMGVRATMTFSIVVNERLWGVIAFHHEQPRTPSQHLRRIGELLLPVLETALTLARREDEIRLLRRASRVREEFERSLRLAPDLASLETIVGALAPQLIEAFQADGLSVWERGAHSVHGATPPDSLMDRIAAAVLAENAEIFAVENLGQRFNLSHNEIGEFGGALCVAAPDGRVITLYRRAKERAVAWAGAPEKTVELVDGMARLSPRGSFARYQETVRGVSEPWLPRDVELARQLSNKLVNTGQKIAIAALARKQALMVDELNHRVRNIVALIRSVSRQARHHNASLDSYQRALEARISALAAAHDLGSGEAINAVSLKQLIAVETRPFMEIEGVAAPQITVTGPDCDIAAPHAPLVALVIHELMTNAAKYGALSTPTGHLAIDLREAGDGFAFSWREIGGPPVHAPETPGFGATLIEKAVPFELGGRADLTFAETGVRAEMWLPKSALSDADEAGARAKGAGEARALNVEAKLAPVASAKAREATILIVEDNFVVAADLEDVLRGLGFRNIEVASSPPDALEIIDAATIDAALLDVNLGAAHGDSFPIAARLEADGVPFAYATGYGARVTARADAIKRPVLTKPVTSAELRETLLALLGAADG
ncbi:MAG: HWE histidine kinase domain-containing protein [Pseudomonadota bacterium]